MLVDAGQVDALVGVELFPEGHDRASHEGLGEEGVGEGVAVVGEKEYLLELPSGLDGELEDVLLGLGDDSLEIGDGIADGHC